MTSWSKVWPPTVAGGASSWSTALIIRPLAMACITFVATVDVGADDPSRSWVHCPACRAQLGPTATDRTPMASLDGGADRRREQHRHSLGRAAAIATATAEMRRLGMYKGGNRLDNLDWARFRRREQRASYQKAALMIGQKLRAQGRGVLRGMVCHRGPWHSFSVRGHACSCDTPARAGLPAGRELGLAGE